MILRRFMKHVTEQNWFAVGLDVIVVIVGIFLGLQVQNWYEDQAERALEREYLLRLHSDADQLIGNAGVFTVRAQNINDNLRSLTSKLLDQDAPSTITRLECNSLAFSHIYVTRIVSMATLDELIASGQILLIKNEEIRRLMSEFTLKTQTTLMLLNSLQADKLDFPRIYPQLIKLTSLQAGNQSAFEELLSECNYPLMSEDDLFINQLVGNNARHGAYVSGMVTQLDALQMLHDEIGRELGIKHEEITQ